MFWILILSVLSSLVLSKELFFWQEQINNNIKVENDGSLPSEDISVVLKEQDIPLLSLSYSINSLKYTYIYELEN